MFSTHIAPACVSIDESDGNIDSCQPTNGQRAKLRARSKSIAGTTVPDTTGHPNDAVNVNYDDGRQSASKPLIVPRQLKVKSIPLDEKGEKTPATVDLDVFGEIRKPSREPPQSSAIASNDEILIDLRETVSPQPPTTSANLAEIMQDLNGIEIGVTTKRPVPGLLAIKDLRVEKKDFLKKGDVVKMILRRVEPEERFEPLHYSDSD